MSERAEQLADQLQSIAEEIADLAIDELRDAMRAGAAGRPRTERTLTQARRAAEKAAHLLRSLDG